MKTINIDNLKKVVEFWKVDRKMEYSKGDVFLISAKIIKNNIYFEKGPIIQERIKLEKYIDIKNDIKINGWNEEYTIIIGIGGSGEIYIEDGNHRLNLIDDILIPVKFDYKERDCFHRLCESCYTKEEIKYKGYETWFLKNQLLPKWSENENSNSWK